MAPHDAETLSGPDRPSSGAALERVAIISDVHGNLPAFRAVLEDAERVGVDALWCLGDLVGYGAQPDECVALARRRCDRCLLGNHDLVALGRLDVTTFSPNAAIAATWTAERLGVEARDYLSGLATHEPDPPIGLFHASPRDPVWEYVLSTMQAGGCMDAMDARMGAIGHSHVALHFSRPDGGRTGQPRAGRDGGRSLHGQVAPQPRGSRAAARRRPARRVDAARPRTGKGLLASRGIPRR
ncbi:MAG: metallophosphoesterase family protein [Thermoleophilaceae bacterium]